MKKLILFCLMLISGLTQAQEFDFSCEPDEEFTYTYNIEIGSGDHTHTLTASKTVTTNDIFELEYAIPNGYAITSGTGAQIAFVGSDWSVKRGAIVVGADSFKVSVKPPSELVDGSKTVNFGTWITAEEVNFQLIVKFDEIDGESITTVVSQTIIGLNPGSIVLQTAIKDGYYITSDYVQDPYDFAGYNIAVEKFEEEWSHFNTTIGLPADLDYSEDIAIQLDLSSYVEADGPGSEDYSLMINGEVAEPYSGSTPAYRTYTLAEDFEGTLNINIEGESSTSSYTITYDEMIAGTIELEKGLFSMQYHSTKLLWLLSVQNPAEDYIITTEEIIETPNVGGGTDGVDSNDSNFASLPITIDFGYGNNVIGNTHSVTIVLNTNVLEQDSDGYIYSYKVSTPRGYVVNGNQEIDHDHDSLFYNVSIDGVDGDNFFNVTFRMYSGFDFDLSEDFGDVASIDIGEEDLDGVIRKANYGNIGTLLDFDLLGDPTPFGDYYDVVELITGDYDPVNSKPGAIGVLPEFDFSSISQEIGSSKFHEFPTAILTPSKSSSHEDFNDVRISGDEYNDYVIVLSEDTYAVIAQWSTDSTILNLVVVTYDDYEGISENINISLDVAITL